MTTDIAVVEEFNTPPERLPEVLPVFPLPGAILLPFARLPLNIFEPRYLNLVFDALAAGRFFGMIQPRETEVDSGHPPLFEIGCAGRISSFSETDDGRLLITLTGLCRFRVEHELELNRGYRRVRARYDEFATDLEDTPVTVPRQRLLASFKTLAERQNLNIDPKILQSLSDRAIVTTVAMLLNFDPTEKQAILEAASWEKRAEILEALMTMMTADTGDGQARSRQ